MATRPRRSRQASALVKQSGNSKLSLGKLRLFKKVQLNKSLGRRMFGKQSQHNQKHRRS